jgi:hypothetical protein
MPAIARCRIVCLPVCHQRIQRLRYTDLQFICCFVRVWNLVKIKKDHPAPTANALSKLLTCNQTLKRKRRDNFRDIRECIFGNNWFIFMKEMSVLARNNCYILPYCQGTDPCGEVEYFAKYSLTASLFCGGTDRRSRNIFVSNSCPTKH